MKRLELQSLLGQLSLRNVSDDREPRRVAREINVADRHLHIDEAPVLAAVPGEERRSKVIRGQPG